MTDLWYDETGAGPPVVLLHEGVVDSRIWEPVVPLLAERHRVIRYDQRGFGRSPMPTGRIRRWTICVSVLDSTGIDAGGTRRRLARLGIALTAALERPDRVSALVLAGSALPGHPLEVDWTPEQIERWEAADEAEDLAAMAELDIEAWAPMGADDELRAMFVENAAGSNGEHPTTDEPVAERVGEISAPTLVVTGSRDVPGINEIGDILAAEDSRGSARRNRGGRSHDSLEDA